MTRYAHQNGFHVDRRFGWDCHGLPVEYEIDKTIGIKSPDDVKKMGVAAYNAECRKIVMRYSKEWEVRLEVCIISLGSNKLEWSCLAVATPDIALYPDPPFNFVVEGWFAKILHVTSLWTSVGVSMEMRTSMMFYFFKCFKHCLSVSS